MIIDNPDAVARYVGDNLTVITNALHNHAERMTAAAADARTQYKAGQDNPETLAAQNASIITNQGYRMSAELFEQDAGKARGVAEHLTRLIDGDDAADDDEPGDDGTTGQDRESYTDEQDRKSYT